MGLGVIVVLVCGCCCAALMLVIHMGRRKKRKSVVGPALQLPSDMAEPTLVQATPIHAMFDPYGGVEMTATQMIVPQQAKCDAAQEGLDNFHLQPPAQEGHAHFYRRPVPQQAKRE